MATTRVVLILGAGPNIGAAIASKFASKGYKVAVASRSGTGHRNDQGYLSLKADFTRPESIPPLYEAIKAEFQAPPNVVVYNAAALTPPPDTESALSIPVEKVIEDLNVNTVSAYYAAQQAISGWETLPKEINKTFIYTGNILNTVVRPVAFMLNLGTGKSASAYWLGVADAAYAAKGYRFFYADERKADGGSKGMEIDGNAHADFYEQLADRVGDVPWHATFVKDTNYVQFN